MANIEYFDHGDLSSEFLQELWKLLPKKATYLTDLIELEEHDGPNVEINYPLQNGVSLLNITSRRETPPIKGGDEYGTILFSPFHMKEARAFRVTDPGRKVLRTADGYKLERNAMLQGMEELEDARAALLWWSVSSMISNKKFDYRNGDTNISIPYEGMIGDLTPAQLSNDFYDSFDKAAREFMLRSNAGLRCVVVSANTWNKIRIKAEVQKYLAHDPANMAVNTDSHILYNTRFIIDSTTYIDPHTKDYLRVKDDVAVFIAEDQSGRKPLRLNRTKDPLNNFDASGPSFRTYGINPEPYEVALAIYDNFVPSIARPNAVMHWNLE